MSKHAYGVGQRVIFRENINGPAEPGTVREVFPIEHNRPVELDVELDGGGSVVAWLYELEAA